MRVIIAMGAALALGVSSPLTFAAQVSPAKASAKSQKKAAAATPTAAEEPDEATKEFEKFRAQMEDSNPAELFEMKGEELKVLQNGVDPSDLP